MIEKTYKYLPNNDQLEEALTEIFVPDQSYNKKVSISQREISEFASTHPSEIVTCILPENSERRFFIKYELNSQFFINDHRKPLDYEIRVYHEVLSAIKMSTPQYLGSFAFKENNTLMLVLEYLDDLIRFTQSDDPDTILDVAKWLGEFHKRSKDLLKRGNFSFLDRYDEKYFLQWPKKTTDIIIHSNLEGRYRWLLDLSANFIQQISTLTGAEPVVIHGEFYPVNVRYANGNIHPLDWQTAALGAPEIDFAAMTHNWPGDIIENCIAVYRAAHNTGESPEIFKKRVLLASIYLNFLWLGYEPDAVNKGSSYIDQLKALATRL